MKIKISNSAINRYTSCGRSYKYHYIDGYRSKIKSSALFFGSAVDAANNYMLENFERKNDPKLLAEAIEIFNENWRIQADQSSSVKDAKVEIPLNSYIKYFKGDFDIDLLSKNDIESLETFLPMEGLLNLRQSVEERLKARTSWLNIEQSQREIYNISSWFSLSHKGKLMLEAYFYNILPQFKRILTLQRKVSLEDDGGNTLEGIVEFVAELNDGRICLVDNKTASSPYAEDSVRTSQQLALYKTILNIQAQTKDAEWQVPIEVAAYAVMSKKIRKTSHKTCSVCNHVATGSHKTCDAKKGNLRCNGEWLVENTFSADTQFIIDSIDEDFGNAVLENASNIITCVDKEVFPKNFERCYNVFGGVCEFLELCHKKNDANLVKLEKKEEKK